MKRDEKWLKGQLDYLLSKYFPNIKMHEPIEICWGREAKFRFGSIRLIKPRIFRKLGGLGSLRKLSKVEPEKSVVTITSMFKSPKIPTKVVQYTIAHELTHYAHGFSSSNRRLFRHPHHGGVVNRELTERGAKDLIGAFKKWLKDYRKMILSTRLASTGLRESRRARA